jgi:glutamine amidotransferase
MHNGVVSDFTPIRRALTAKMSDAAFANVFGSTDSEHMAAL